MSISYRPEGDMIVHGKPLVTPLNPAEGSQVMLSWSSGGAKGLNVDVYLDIHQAALLVADLQAVMRDIAPAAVTHIHQATRDDK